MPNLIKIGNISSKQTSKQGVVKQASKSWEKKYKCTKDRVICMSLFSALGSFIFSSACTRVRFPGLPFTSLTLVRDTSLATHSLNLSHHLTKPFKQPLNLYVILLFQNESLSWVGFRTISPSWFSYTFTAPSQHPIVLSWSLNIEVLWGLVWGPPLLSLLTLLMMSFKYIYSHCDYKEHLCYREYHI